jgi:hypothetical protein
VSISTGYAEEAGVPQEDASTFLLNDDSSSSNAGGHEMVVPDNKSSPLGGWSVLSDSRMVSCILALIINGDLQGV